MKEESVWNCNNSTFFLSLREFKNPGLSFEKAVSSGAKRVNPPEPEVTSCELSWLMSCVVSSRRMRTENLFAFFRIWIISMVGAFGAAAMGAPLGETGTRGTVLNPGDGAVVVGGDGAGWVGGSWAKVVVVSASDSSRNLTEKKRVQLEN
ncbi:hypothetical protein Ahy_B10g100574 [Arachis hypogaea]|uniref:Uncharacterized protein n=1 Tax=Arachis hypogaea TaxID=3818 RepID=A0A444WX95_ARAHY|nr:hypothetical protein Ahy_B10g100574 [Arachis hypogaea]